MNSIGNRFFISTLVPTFAVLVTNVVHAAPIAVTDIKLNSTANDSLQLVITTSATAAIETLPTSVENNTLLIDIPNAQLQLPERESIRWSDPSVEITAISVVQQSPDSIRVRIEGATTLPEVNLVSVEEGIALNLPQQGSLAETTPDRLPTEAAEGDDEPIELVVTATRTEQPARNIPRSTTVISREEIEQQSQLSNNLPDILGRTVPGLGPPSQSASNRAQSLRGRQPSVLIDGVPISSNLSVFQDLRSIAPSSVERVEVVRGPTSIFGAEASGGVINIITRQPEDQPFIARTTVSLGPGLSLGNFSQSFGAGVEQFFSGRVGDFDYLVNTSYEETGNAFDAEGDIIPIGNAQGLSNLESFNLLAKAGVDITSEQRLQLTVNYFDDKQDPPTLPDLSVNELDERVKARPLDLDGELELEELPGRENLTINLAYSHDDLFGSQLDAQIFFRESTTLSIPRDNRDTIFQSVSRTITESEKVGARLDIETPITSNFNVLWGADYSNESIEQPLPIFDPDVFDNSNGTAFEQIDEAFFSPPYDLESLGLFAQLNWEPSNKLALTGGLRFERFELSVDDYDALGSIDFRIGGVFDVPDAVTGGEVSFDDVVFNIGAVYDLTEEVSLFANFSQGFSAPDFRRFLRDLPARVEPLPPPTPSVSDVIEVTEPVVIDNYEIGVRGNWNNVQASLAGFFTYSEFSTIPPSLTSGADLGRVERAPVRTYGIEAALDYQVSEQWQLGSTFTWVEGESSPEDVDGFIPLTTRIIQPLKFSFYVQNQTTPQWANRLQLLVVGSRDRAFEETDANGNPIDPFPINSYATFDWVSSLDLGSGRLTFAVQNLLNNQYFPVDSQISGTGANSEFAAALGRTVSLQYQLSW